MTETMGADRAVDATGRDGGGQVPAGELFTRAAVTVIMAVIAMVAFAFSFGNIWALGLHLGVSPWISPLVGPAADLTVVGLLVAVQYLSLAGDRGSPSSPCALSSGLHRGDHVDVERGRANRARQLWPRGI